MFLHQIEESETTSPPPPQPTISQSASIQSNGHIPTDQPRPDTSLGYVSGLGASPAPNSNTGVNGLRPSNQLSPHTASPSTHPTQSAFAGSQQSVISVDEGTTSRGNSAMFSSE